MVLPYSLYGFYYLPVYSFIPKDKDITISQAYLHDSDGSHTDIKDKISILSRNNYDNYFIPLATTDSSLAGKVVSVVLSI